MIHVLVCTQSIDKNLRRKNAITKLQQFQTRVRSHRNRRRTQYTRREDNGIRQNIEQDTRHECRDSKDNTSLESLKKHSDQIQQEISTSQEKIQI